MPTTGRASLDVLLAALGAADGPLPERVFARRRPARRPRAALAVRAARGAARPDPRPAQRRRGPGRGPQRRLARGVGAVDRASSTTTSSPRRAGAATSRADLRDLPEHVAGSQGRIRVPLPRDRRPTDWERNVAGLEHARWATADLAYRRAALEAVGGFDERFPRAYREDADLGLRLVARGWDDRPRARAASCTRSAPPTAGCRCASRPATPTTR